MIYAMGSRPISTNEDRDRGFDAALNQNISLLKKFHSYSEVN